MSGETNRLTALAQEVMGQPTVEWTCCFLGEQVTIALWYGSEKRGYEQILHWQSGAHSH